MPDNTHAQEQHKHTNRLINETSPYLLQHAHNPVDWYPWSGEALEKAKREDKPILLSVGYSACHWCHVMERESFENEEIAGLMNQHFVSIKVDREERPDIDNIYMQAVQAMTHAGGWPMTVFLTPDGRPFYGGTYFPPSDRRYGGQVMPGFPRVLISMAEAYKNRLQEVEEQATELANYLKQHSSAPLRGENIASTGTLPLELLSNASRELAADFDPVHGGFGNAPKFPNTMTLEFLLRIHQHRLRGEIGARSTHPEMEIVETSLQHMADGGIYDQLGGGFHRYSVDAEWLVPHFEKMLYDNALLSRLYLHAYLVTGKTFYRRIAGETLDYVVREMTSPEGGFYSTQDADSEGEEGKFFLWTPAQIEAVLPPGDAALFMRYYDVTQQGNFEGKNILHVVGTSAELAERVSIPSRPGEGGKTHVESSPGDIHTQLQRSRELLFKAREQRVKPGRDEKILTSWNGLMLRSFAEAARHLDHAGYLQVATRNAEFLLRELRREGRVLRTYKDGRGRLNGYLEDYAFLADGLLALHEASFETRWFVEARRLMDEAVTLFTDRQNGGFFDTGSDHEALVSRPKDIMDNATPAGNSVAAEVLLRLAAFTGEEKYRQRADDYLRSLADIMVQHPQAFGHALGALDFAISQAQEIAIIGEVLGADTRNILGVINARYLPASVLACAAPGDSEAIQAIPLLVDRPLKDGRATAYVCQNFACQAPVNTPGELERLL
jgi:uncharacterized protein YyaL (SSP411 family)